MNLLSVQSAYGSPSNVQESPNDIRNDFIFFIHWSSRFVPFGNGDSLFGCEGIDAEFNVDGG